MSDNATIHTAVRSANSTAYWRAYIAAQWSTKPLSHTAAFSPTIFRAINAAHKCAIVSANNATYAKPDDAAVMSALRSTNQQSIWTTISAAIWDTDDATQSTTDDHSVATTFWAAFLSAIHTANLATI